MKKSAETLLAERNAHQEKSRDTRRHKRALASYLKMPKYLSPPETFERFWHQRTNIVPTSQYEYSVSSSILSEMAITAIDRSSTERHAILDMAEWDLSEAVTILQAREAQSDSIYYQKFLQPPSILRLESQRSALGLFRGMVDGDINRGVRSQYAEDILRLSVQASEGFQYFQHTCTEIPSPRATEYIGLAHELNAIYSIARKKSPTLAAFPAFARGDSGVFLPTQTHDIHVVGMYWGAIEDSIIAEVKTRPKPDHYERYEAILIGGTVHLHPDNSPDPSYLAELYAKEYRGITTSDEFETLEDISRTVIHSVRHGFTDTTQCRNPKTCTLDT